MRNQDCSSSQKIVQCVVDVSSGTISFRLVTFTRQQSLLRPPSPSSSSPDHSIPQPLPEQPEQSNPSMEIRHINQRDIPAEIMQDIDESNIDRSHQWKTTLVVGEWTEIGVDVRTSTGFIPVVFGSSDVKFRVTGPIPEDIRKEHGSTIRCLGEAIANRISTDPCGNEGASYNLWYYLRDDRSEFGFDIGFSSVASEYLPSTRTPIPSPVSSPVSSPAISQTASVVPILPYLRQTREIDQLYKEILQTILSRTDLSVPITFFFSLPTAIDSHTSIIGRLISLCEPGEIPSLLARIATDCKESPDLWEQVRTILFSEIWKVLVGVTNMVWFSHQLALACLEGMSVEWSMCFLCDLVYI